MTAIPIRGPGSVDLAKLARWLGHVQSTKASSDSLGHLELNGAGSLASVATSPAVGLRLDSSSIEYRTVGEVAFLSWNGETRI